MRLAAILIPGVLVLGAGLTLSACGQDPGPPAVSSAPDTTGADTPGAAAGAGTAAGAPGSERSATAQSCLDLVADGQLAQAIDPCTRAAREAPGDREVSEALAKARSAADQAARDAAQEAESWKKAGEALAR